MVSHLVTGVTEREFVTLLHQDLTHAHQHAVDDPSPTIQRTNLETIREGRRQSLKSKDVKYERERLLQESASDDGTTTARLLLSADPFVQTIAEVHFEHDDDVSTIGGSFTRISEMEGSVHYEGGGGGVMSSEAFLLSIPTHTLGNANEHAMSGSYYSSGGAGGAKENMFVLALPEMDIQPKEEETDFSKPTNMFRSSAASVSSTVAAVAAEEISHFLRHPFAPLPTDVQHIEIRVSTTPAHLEVKKDVGDLEEPPLQEAHLDVVIDRKVPLIAYIILVTGLIALSSTGVSYDVQRGGVSPEMKTFWRFNSTSVAFFFLAMKSFNRKEFAKYSKMELLVWMPFAGLNYSFMCTAFVIALDMTSLVNTLSK